MLDDIGDSPRDILRARTCHSSASAPPRWPPSGRRDVLVALEQVRRVVAALDLGQPVPGRPGVGVADPLRALVAQEVDVGAVVVLLRSRASEPSTQALLAGAVVGRPS